MVYFSSLQAESVVRPENTAKILPPFFATVEINKLYKGFPKSQFTTKDHYETGTRRDRSKNGCWGRRKWLIEYVRKGLPTNLCNIQLIHTVEQYY